MLLTKESALCKQTLPSLHDLLSREDVMILEESGGRNLANHFKKYGAPNFLIPKDYGGEEGTLVKLVQVLTFVGARCPSLSIMMTMHHHSVGGLVVDGFSIKDRDNLLEHIACNSSLVASAFSESRQGADILDSTVSCTREKSSHHYIVNGYKKPCSMSNSADFILVGVTSDSTKGSNERGLCIIENSNSCLQTEKFWISDILSSTDSNCVVFKDINVCESRVLLPDKNSSANFAAEKLKVTQAEIVLSCMFQVMAAASYIGMTTRFSEICMANPAGSKEKKLQIISALKSSTLALNQLARSMDRGDYTIYTLSQSMLLSFSIRERIDNILSTGSDLLSPREYLGNKEVHYLMHACKCFNFHPPSIETIYRIVFGVYF